MSTGQSCERLLLPLGVVQSLPNRAVPPFREGGENPLYGRGPRVQQARCTSVRWRGWGSSPSRPKPRTESRYHASRLAPHASRSTLHTPLFTFDFSLFTFNFSLFTQKRARDPCLWQEDPAPAWMAGRSPADVIHLRGTRPCCCSYCCRRRCCKGRPCKNSRRRASEWRRR